CCTLLLLRIAIHPFLLLRSPLPLLIIIIIPIAVRPHIKIRSHLIFQLLQINKFAITFSIIIVTELAPEPNTILTIPHIASLVLHTLLLILRTVLSSLLSHVV